MASLFKQDIQYLKGVGSKRQAQFEKLGVKTIGALLHTYPKGYDDFTNICTINSAPINIPCCIKAKIISSAPSQIIVNKGISIYKVQAESEGVIFYLTFFNNKFTPNSLNLGKEYLLYGKIKPSLGIKEMISPEVLKSTNFSCLRPIYLQTEGLKSKQIETIVKNALNLLPEELNEPIPENIRKKHNLCSLKEAIHSIHFPKDKEQLNKARNYLVFEELLILQISLLSIKSKNSLKSSVSMQNDYLEEAMSKLPFSLTTAQSKVITECTKDMLESGKGMRRLIQGDVGCGKTIVAFILCYNIIKNGYQAAFMAPTEILAAQHYESFLAFFKNTEIKISLLTGSTPKALKTQIKKSLENNETHLIIGTHALLSDDTNFFNLGLVITDEQHRFGVNQRAKLSKKGENPHVLVMSATPIPRTLALILYGDLDISIIDELPKGRQRIDTFCIDSSKKERALGFIKNLVNQGQQAYIVCPLVEENESNLISSEKYAKDLQTNFFKDYKVGLLHGKMHSKEKDSVMKDFLENKINILVSTTVVEVGIDVKNASVIMIENSDRFGLSQLHQLRGRVGRGTYKSYCILVSDNKSSVSVSRLQTLCTTNDGLKIADEDLKIRGPGEFFGKKQHGTPILKISNLISDIDILQLAKTCALEILDEDPFLLNDKNRVLKASISQFFHEIQ